MKNALSSLGWRDYLPEIYSWMDAKAPAASETLRSGGHHIVPVETKSDNAQFTCAADGLTSEKQDALLAAAKATGWLGKKPALLSLADEHFCLVPVSKVKSTPVQLARQVGIDAAAKLSDCQIGAVVFMGSRAYPVGAVYEGYTLGAYSAQLFTGKRANARKKKVEALPKEVFYCGSSTSVEEWERYLAQAKAAAFTRMLQDGPPNWLDSELFGTIAADISKELGMKCSVNGRKYIQELGMGSFSSVADGTPKDPKLIVIEIEGRDPSKTVALIGKGLTFDAGGNSIKPAAGMGEMKYDMSGGAAVMGAAFLLGHVKPAVNVVCMIGAVENMPGGKATRPSDIVVAMNGKSIDVLNTDAEGRLVLCDLLHYAEKEYAPELMIDVATLTGAVLHGLGHVGAAVMGNDQPSTERILAASQRSGEPCWQLPLWPELESEVKSEFADLQNIAKPSVLAGSIIGGIFLQEFVDKTNWAHMDIAGTGWSCKAVGFPASGGSSFAVRTLSEVCWNFGG